MLKVGLVGIGGMGNVHFNAYKKVDICKVVAVADVREDMAKEKVNDETVKIYHDIDEMIKNEELDIIDICTPSYMHAELAIKALESGHNVICEKPMTLTVEDAEKVEAVAKKSGKKFMVAHVVRFMQPYVYLAKEIKSGEMGKLVRLSMRRMSSIPRWSWEDWMRDLTKSGGTPIDLSIHDIDYIQSVLGMPDDINSVYFNLSENNDLIVTNMIYGDALVTTEAGWYNATFPFEASYTAIFENGFIVLQKDGTIIKNGEPVEIELGDVSENTGINITGTDGYGEEIKYFANCVKNDIAPDFVTPASSKASIELVHKILEKAIIK